jgi:hypothetical protein
MAADEPYFASQRKFSRNVLVTWTVDMRPAYYQIILGHDSLVAGQGNRNGGARRQYQKVGRRY